MKAIFPSLACIAMLCGSVLLHAQSPSAALVADGWKGWESGDHALARQKFTDASKADPNDARPLFGLSILDAVEGRDNDAWRSYKAAMDKQPDPYPYIYAAWTTGKLRGSIGNEDLEIVPMLEKLTEHADSLGILKGMANEVLGGYYEHRGEMSTSRRYYRAIGSINEWTVIGPFDNISASGHDKVFPPEQSYEPTAIYPGKNGEPANWFKLVAVRNDNWIDFRRYFGDNSSVFYANTFVWSPKRQTVHVRLGTSGSFKVFLNDELVDSTIDEYDNDLDSYIAETELQEGWNRLMIKCGCAESKACNFLLRLTDTHGDPLSDLKIATDPQSYRRSPGARSRRIENFAETFFKKKVAAEPDRIENYLLLADCYLRNDKAIEAELTLREAITRWPSAPALYDRILEAYSRSNKDDEHEKTLEKIYALDQNVPSGLVHKFSEYMEKEEYDKAEDIISRLEKISPDDQGIYSLRMGIYSKKGLTEKILDLTHDAYKRYPDNSMFVMGEAYINSKVTNSQTGALKILNEYISRNSDEEVIQHMASLYLESSDKRNWRAMYDRLLELDPAAPGYYWQLADGYFTMQDYESARGAINSALAICPSSSRIWERLGEIERITGNKEKAIAAYREALKYQPTDYDVRATLRELEGKRSLFELFPQTNVDSLIRNAPSVAEYPDEKGVILFDEAQRVVYDRGASESTQELVVKVFNDRGIDDWKEYTIGYNSYNEALNVEKAVVVKKDGSEVKADVNENYVVFKTLEQGDILHLKWRVRNYYSGKLSSHFWERYNFSGYYPERHVRYSLLAPADFKFAYAAQSMPAEPVKSTLDDGVLYRWSADSVPAISYEYGMPTLDDVGRILYISSIPNWNYLVDWYADITKAKTRSSYEIKEQVAGLLKDHPNPNEEEKIRMVYDFITENIRYSSVAFRQGAHIPQKARDVLVNKIGDCKDVATLCIAMLNELGLKANYVLVNTRDEGLNRNALPSIAFNHCIVAVETSHGLQYLDLTANNYPFGSMPEPDLSAFALLIRSGTTAPTYLTPSGLLGRNVVMKTTAAVSQENVLTGRRKTMMTGSIAAAMRASLRDESKKEQEKMFLASLSTNFPNAKLNSLEIKNLDNLSPQVEYEYAYEVPNYITDAGDFKFMKIPWSRFAKADEALSYDKREYPYYYWPGEDTLTEQVEIVLPAGFRPVDLPKPVKLSSPIADYTMQYTFADGKLVAQRRFINKKEVVETSEYPEFKSFFNNVVKEDARQILFKKK